MYKLQTLNNYYTDYMMQDIQTFFGQQPDVIGASNRCCEYNHVDIRQMLNVLTTDAN